MHYFMSILVTRKRELFALLLLSFGCHDTKNVLWLFLRVPWVGLRFVIVVFPNHPHLLFYPGAGMQTMSARRQTL